MSGNKHNSLNLIVRSGGVTEILIAVLEIHGDHWGGQATGCPLCSLRPQCG